jgi:hypothetical protein
MDAAVSGAQIAHRTNDAAAYGEVVWSCRPDAGVKFAGHSQAMVAKEPGHQGEHEGNRKAIAQGRPGESGEPVVTTLVCFFQFAREAAGASRAPGFPCALCCFGAKG